MFERERLTLAGQELDEDLLGGFEVECGVGGGAGGVGRGA